MGRKRRKDNPPAILRGTRHHESCVCNRCLDADAAKVDKQLAVELERAWERHNKENGMQLPNIHLSSKESPIIGPFEGTGPSVYVTCPPAIVFRVTPKGKRRK